MKGLRSLFAFFLICGNGIIFAQSFTIAETQLQIAAVPGFDHAELQIAITAAPGFDYGALAVTSDVAWIVPRIEGTAGVVVLSFKTGHLINSANTGTITVQGSGTSDIFFVKAMVAPLNVVKHRAS